MDMKLTNRGLLRAVLVAFALFLTYRFLAAVLATVLLLAAALQTWGQISELPATAGAWRNKPPDTKKASGFIGKD